LKIAVSATGGSLEATVDPRFGRCPHYIIVDTETLAFEDISNTSMDFPSGAGIGAAQLVAGRGVEAVVTGAVGPNAMAVLSQAGIKIVTGAQGNIRQAVEAFKKGELGEAPIAGYRGLYGGGGRGTGMGRGMGIGRGMGTGRGMGLYQTPISPAQRGPMSREQEQEALRSQLEQLESQLREVKKRLDEIEK
jgi:predicted Fe-Mo cluster-binding NifX family protein